MKDRKNKLNIMVQWHKVRTIKGQNLIDSGRPRKSDLERQK